MRLLPRFAQRSGMTVALAAAVGAGLSTAGFFAERRWEREIARARFESAADNRVSALRRELAGELARLGLFQELIGRAPRSDPAELVRPVALPPERTGWTEGYEWIPASGLVSQRAVFHGALAPAFPDSIRSTLEAARDSGQARLTPRLALAAPGPRRYGALLVVPVFRHARGLGGPPAEAAQRRKLLHGYVATLLTPGDLLEQGLRYLRPHGIDLYLFDRSAAERDAFLYYHRSRMNRAPGTKTGADLARPRVPLQYAATIAAGGREWELICTPIEGGVEHTWESWGILAVGLGLTAAVAAWLRSVLSHTEAVERKVVRRTRELAAARDQALESSRLKSQFLANMSHEIRTPMNGILGFTQLALDTRLDELQRDYLETVETSARSLLRVINDILDLSKIEAGRVDLEHTPFALRACLEDAVRTVSAEAARKGLLLDCAIDARAPETLVGDAARLRQVLLNLLGNAVKFTASGWVRAEVVARDGELDFVVRDTGPGVPAEKQQVIFEAFRQADDSVTRRFGGTGLGLTISARLVELMGGRIWMESRPGAGSAFHVTLPAPARESGGAARASSEAAVPAGNGR